MAALLATRVLLARTMDPAGYGAFGIGLSLTTVASKLLAFGIVPATQYYGSKESAQRSSFVKTALSLALFVSMLSLGGLWWIMPRYLTSYWAINPASHVMFLSMIPLMPVIIMSAVLTIIFIPRGQIFHFNIFQMMGGVLMPLFFGAALLFLAPPVAAVLGQVLAWIFIFAFCVWSFRYDIRLGMLDHRLACQLLLYGLKTWPYVVLSVGAARFALIIGTSQITETEAGFYIVALNVIEGMFGFYGGLGQLLLSKVSMREASSYNQVQLLMRTSVAAVAVIGSGYMLLGRPTLVLFFGRGYEEAFPLSLVLLIMGAAHAQQSLLVNFMAGIGRPFRNTVTVAVEMVVLAIAVPVLTLRYGATGLAWAAAVAAIIALVISFYQALHAMKCSHMDLLVLRKADLAQIGREIRNVASFAFKRKNLSAVSADKNVDSNL